MLKNENGEDRLLTRIQFLGWALVLFMGLVGAYAKFSGENVARDKELEFLKYQISEEKGARIEESKALKGSIIELAASVKDLAKEAKEVIGPAKRVMKWLDEAPDGPRGK